MKRKKKVKVIKSTKALTKDVIKLEEQVASIELKDKLARAQNALYLVEAELKEKKAKPQVFSVEEKIKQAEEKNRQREREMLERIQLEVLREKLEKIEKEKGITPEKKAQALMNMFAEIDKIKERVEKEQRQKGASALMKRFAEIEEIKKRAVRPKKKKILKIKK